MTNKLINETSPYLLQHAHNPVNWLHWSDEALELAKEENKLMIISIGYSACHWCHVMEKESFEDNEVAELMNDYFISVKIDREERPDLDSIFMDVAVMINGNGGWPLNVITLPNGKPVYALTYLPKSRWMMLLNNLKELWDANPVKLNEQADSIMNGLLNYDNYLIYIPENKIEFNYNDLSYLASFDFLNGGLKGAPKFPMPVVFEYLLSVYKINKDVRIKDILETTFNKMALGGIYDTLAGGFARYSVDDKWFAPHFEKMLYDNGQLLSLYSKAYNEFGYEFYKEIAIQTAEFHINKMMNNDNMFYSAIDADSEGVEGKYYIWTYNEIKEILGEDADIFIDYYNITPSGNWENAENILFAKKTLQEFSIEKNIDYNELKAKIEFQKTKLLLEREKRVYPQIDDKIIVSWNCLFSIGLIDLYKATNQIKYLGIAEKNINSILSKCTNDNLVYRNYKDGIYKTNAFLDDYAFLIKVLIKLYLATQKNEYIEKAYNLMKYSLSHFFGENTLLLKYSNSLNEKLLKEKYETWDNVLPSSNSVIAESLLLLGTIYSDNNLLVYYSKIMASISVVAKRNPLNYSNWFNNYVLENNLIEVTIIGKKAKEYKSMLNDKIEKHILIFVSETENELPIFKDRFIESETMIYICKNKTCYEPITVIEKAIEKINEL